jgi:hypothetical protein
MVIGPSELLALISTVGGGLPTFTVTLSEAEPPGPVQVKVYVRELVRLPVDSEPEVGLEPDQAPEAAQAVALVEVQERVAEVL